MNPDLGEPNGGPAQLKMAGTGAGHSVVGFLGPIGSTSDPGVPFPTSNPGPPFTFKAEDFAGIVLGDPGGGGANVELYCINIRTDTFSGVGYDLGTWDVANVATSATSRSCSTTTTPRCRPSPARERERPRRRGAGRGLVLQ